MFRIRDPKSSSTGNVMLSSTIENPDVKLVIKCVSTLLHSNLLDDMEDEKSIDPKSELYFFDEEKIYCRKSFKFQRRTYCTFKKSSKTR